MKALTGSVRLGIVRQDLDEQLRLTRHDLVADLFEGHVEETRVGHRDTARRTAVASVCAYSEIRRTV